MTNAFLAINVGSSSIKFSVFAANQNLKELVSGNIYVKDGVAEFLVKGQKAITISKNATPKSGIDYLIKWLKSQKTLWNIIAIGHRVVHGGKFTHAITITPSVIKELTTLSTLAPLHQPYNILAIKKFMQTFPKTEQIACFDTSFHTTISKLVRSYAIPKKYRDSGVKRYGFHGLSYQWVANVLKTKYPTIYNSRVVAAHLGNGSSLCAMKRGKSLDTTMGMTALDGLPMGTRSGTIDTGTLIYMLRNYGLSLDELEHILEFDSGLKGLSGISNDVRTLITNNSTACKFALDFYAFKVAQGIAQMAVSASGIDALIFTGGIGENATSVRRKILSHLKFLGNFKVIIIKCDEERMIALNCLRLL